jgi:hypothetical protein
MVLLGVDPHKDTHTVVAVDQAGRQLDQTTVPARTLGHGQLVGWARARWPGPGQRLWAVEDCGPRSPATGASRRSRHWRCASGWRSAKGSNHNEWLGLRKQTRLQPNRATRPRAA